MSFLRKLAPWISRVALLPTIAIFTMVGGRHLLRPTATAAAQAIMFAAPHGITALRVGFGGFPLGAALFLLVSLFVRSWMLQGLIFSALMLAVVTLARAYGMEVDATVATNLRLLVSEFILLGITLAGIAAELYWRAETRRPA
jgi:hypothetical protein